MTAPLPLAALAEWGWLDSSFVQLIDRRPAGVAVTLTALALAAGVGAVHALGPGHGKALIGAYLAGSRGGVRDAVALGGVVATMHVGSVLALGCAFYFMQRMPVGERLEPVLMLASSTLVAAVGAAMLWKHRRARHPARVGGGAHPGEHGPEPGTEHEHRGPAAPDGMAPLSRSGLAALATTGGLLPSPAAFLVLTTALVVGRVGYGLALVAAFSLGLAATLTAVGLGVLSGRGALVGLAEGRVGLQRLTGLLAPVSAAAVLLGGVVMAAAALLRLSAT